MNIFLVAFVKYSDTELFKRCNLQTFATSLEKAKEHKKNFCDEAGWYDGMLIEKMEEDNWLRGTRVFFKLNENNELQEIEEPPMFNNVVNLI